MTTARKIVVEHFERLLYKKENVIDELISDCVS